MKKKKSLEFDPAEKPSLKGKSVNDYKRIIDVLYKELQRRDSQIDELKQENEILMKTAFKAQEKAAEVERLMSKLKEKKSNKKN
ncbi:hypothetical protein JXB41_06945 [Candidatus Woesearchaeota archaeon]|nr:hypothetical protein [Candidatus Woesearchaeota archaeon]